MASPTPSRTTRRSSRLTSGEAPATTTARARRGSASGVGVSNDGGANPGTEVRGSAKRRRVEKPTSPVSADADAGILTSSSKSIAGNLFGGAGTSRFYPLRFAFCENWQSALPLISLQYHDVELRITWGSTAATDKWDIYTNYAYLDTQEREVFAAQPQNMIMTQVQKAISSGTAMRWAWRFWMVWM